MRRLFFVLLLACGGTRDTPPVEGPEEQVPAEAPDPASDEAPDPTPDPAPEPVVADDGLEAPAWSWSGDDGRPDPATREVVDAGGLTCRFVVRDGAHLLSCSEGDGDIRWSRRDRGHRGEAALLLWGETLVVARYGRNTSGCTVFAYDVDTGAERWRAPLLGLGPIRHSRYANAVRLWRDPSDGNRIVVAGWETQGKYLELLDPQQTAGGQGRQLGVWREQGGAWNRVPSPPDPDWRSWSTLSRPDEGAAAGRDFDWQGPIGDVGFERDESVSAAGANCRWRAREDLTELECSRGESPLWGFRVADDMNPGAKLLVDDDTLYVVRFHPMATGCVVRAYQLSTGAERWRKRLWGAGEVVHSRYRNEVQARLNAGRVEVLGWESSDRYLEILDARSGRTLGHRSFGNARP